ncbi:MAG: hypothetical protein O3B84_05875, partial [Chloroflexi bacterium]|nr:hypothetical protein [Chloroflexota bacterium]
MRPATYLDLRVGNVLELGRILASTAVSLRGWDFPHIDSRTSPRVGREWIEQNIDWEMHVEFWRFYQSGQFVHFAGLHEDWLDQAQMLSIGAGSPAGERLGVVSAVYRFS